MHIYTHIFSSTCTQPFIFVDSSMKGSFRLSKIKPCMGGNCTEIMLLCQCHHRQKWKRQLIPTRETRLEEYCPQPVNVQNNPVNPLKTTLLCISCSLDLPDSLLGKEVVSFSPETWWLVNLVFPDLIFYVIFQIVLEIFSGIL